MNDDALSPVIAVMLILAVVVTGVSVWNSSYLPAMKEQAEIEHIQDVEDAFLGLSASIENTAILKDRLQVKARIPLGGGDVMFNTVTSGGSLWVRQDPAPSRWMLQLEANGTFYNMSLMNITYTPANNFWQNQGYSWQWGYVNVTKGSLATPLEYTTMARVAEHTLNSSFAASLIGIEGHGEYFYTFNTSENTTYVEAAYFNLTDLEVTMVAFVPGEDAFVSGNGIGTIEVSSSLVDLHDADTRLTLRVARTATVVPLGFNTSLWNTCTSSLEEISHRPYDNIKSLNISQGEEYDEAVLETSQPLHIALHRVIVTVSAY
jgi:hypothetical protein